MIVSDSFGGVSVDEEVTSKNMSAFDNMKGVPKDAAEIEALLDSIDINGDGDFSREEVTQVIMHMGHLQNSLKQFKMVALMAFIALIFVAASMLAITLLANEISKDQVTTRLSVSRIESRLLCVACVTLWSFT
eukprot:COSAG01_NODE_1846_length_9050_cov_10.563991_9_plen_133_part_00